MRIDVINGPNLNMLGTREPDLYGASTLGDLEESLREDFEQVEFRFFQDNVEGELVTLVQQAGNHADGVVLNGGGYTHTSVALRDAVASVGIPVVEVHVTNIAAREPFRRRSLLTAVCAGHISGFGPLGYRLAVQALLDLADREA